MSEIKTHLRVLFELEIKSFIGLSLLFLFFGVSAFAAQIFLEDIMKLAGFEIIGLPEPSALAVMSDYWGDLVISGGIIAIFYGMKAFSADLNVDKQVFYILNHPISRNNHYLGKSFLKILVLNSVIILSSLVTYLLSVSIYDGVDFIDFIKATLIVSLGASAFLSVILGVNSILTTAYTVVVGIIFMVIQIVMGFFGGFFKWLQWFSPAQISSNWTNAWVGDNVLWELIGLLLWNIMPIMLGMMYYSRRDL